MEREDDPTTKGLKCLSPELQKEIKTRADSSPLPLWPIQTRGIPNICLRSSLFGVIQRGRRKAVKGEVIAAVKGLDIRYTGWRLDQGDFDVLIHALHLVSLQQTTGEYVRFTGKGFLHGIGRRSGKSGREWLKDCLRRLTGSAVEITLEVKNSYWTDSYTYAGSLVDEFIYNSSSQGYFLKINPKLGRLFNAGWTQLQWHQRLKLKTDLAKWLHGFYASHKEPYPIKVATLKHLCGASIGRLSDFRGKLRRALDELTKAELITSWKIDLQDKVHVKKRDTNYPGTPDRGHSSRNQGA
ncbi:MAG: TrfA family protein [Proteobacteria bacterium]|nr:TrfA family protein [Pseudomonadota bacterium]